MKSRAPKVRNASAPNGGAGTTAIAHQGRRAIITSSRMRPVTSSGFTAKGSTSAKRRPHAGSCKACSRNRLVRVSFRTRKCMSAYAELAVTTNFSFLRGASHPQEIVAAADELQLTAVGIADRNSFAGVVRAYDEAKNRKVRLLVGTRLVTIDGFEALAYPTNREAYGRLCRLVTAGNLKAKKGECHLIFEDILAASEGQMLIAIPPRTIVDGVFTARLSTLARAAPRRTFLAGIHYHCGDESRRLGLLAELGERGDARLVAVNDVF